MLDRARWRPGGDLRLAVSQIIPVAVWAGAIALAVFSVVAYLVTGWTGVDSHAYWLAGRTDHPYGVRPGEVDAFLYSPLFAQLMRPLALAPWPVFCAASLAVEAAAYWWLLRPLPTVWRVPALLACVPAVMIGNVYGLLGVALVLALRRSGFLALPVLTKVTPGAVGVLWFSVRGEWMKVVRFVAVTGLLVAVSYAAEPGLWVEWLRFLSAHSEDGLLRLLRIPLGLVVAVYAARRDRPWVLAVAYWLTMPVVGHVIQSLVALAPLVRLRETPGTVGAARRTASSLDIGPTSQEATA